MAKWVLLRSNGNTMEYAKRFRVHPLIIQLLSNRRISSEKELEAFFSEDISAGSKYEGLPDIDKALALLSRIKEDGRKVRIIGDYDVDGVLSTVILIKGLKAYGIEADYAIPHRVLDGYGMNVRLIEEAYQDGIRVIITCDNGISAQEEIRRAKELGMTVIVTDHHEVPKEHGAEKLPPADAIIEPKREESTYPLKELCGAQVAYKLISALSGFDKDALTEEEEALKEELLMFSGLASYEDVMPLVSENHRIVKWSIAKVKESRNKGLRALVRAKDLADKEIKSYQIGFLLGPCINASGRLDSAERAVELFLSDSEEEANEEALEMVRLNEERKDMTLLAEEEALSQIGQLGEGDKVLVLYLPKVHESIAGIVAGRIRERFQRPAFILTDSKEGIKGSGRSVEAYSMYEALAAHSELFQKFGGHKMAAGLTLKEGCLEEFRRALNRDCTLTDADFEEKLKIDAIVSFSEFTCELVEQINRLEPFGSGCEKPLFAARDVRVISLRPFGKNQEYLNVNVEEGGRFYTLKAFRSADAVKECLIKKYGSNVLEEIKSRKDVFLHVAYEASIHEYQGVKSVEFHLIHCM